MPDVEALSELLQLTRELRAHVEWQQATGATGLPRGTTPGLEQPAPEPAAVVAAEPARSPSPQRQAAPQPQRAPAPAPVAAPLAPLGLSRAERSARLEVIASEVRACTRCGLHETRTQTVFARGNGSSGLCFIGEGPGADEDAQGSPFVGPAGQLLDKMIAAMGLDREEV